MRESGRLQSSPDEEDNWNREYIIEDERRPLVLQQKNWINRERRTFWSWSRRYEIDRDHYFLIATHSLRARESATA